VPAPKLSPPIGTPPIGDVRAAAGPVLGGLGLDHATVRVETYPGLGLVTAAPVLDGLPTSGWETRLFYDQRLRLTAGSGWLGVREAGMAYPRVSARRARDALPVLAVAVPMAAAQLGCASIAPPRCPGQIQPVITGARPGLLLSYAESGAALLVPAWL